MEFTPHPNVKFMARFPRVEPLARDHSSMKLAKDCMLKYFFQVVLGFREKSTPQYFVYGGAYHKFKEVLEQSKGDIKLAAESAITYFMKRGGNPPVGTKYDHLTVQRLVKSFGLAFKSWEKEKSQGRIEVLAIEQIATVPLPNGGPLISGKLDQIVRWNQKVWGRDFKTSSKNSAWFSRGLSPNDQMIRYTYIESQLCGEPVQGQIVEVLFNSKKEGPKIEEFLAAFTRGEIDRWIAEQIEWERTLQRARETNIWPRNENHCVYCPFHSVCKRPTEAAMMAALENDYVMKPHDPTKFGEVDE